jgi:hypothetical protein
MAGKMHKWNGSAYREQTMENSKRRAIGFLVVFATVLTVIAAWNLPETDGKEQ